MEYDSREIEVILGGRVWGSLDRLDERRRRRSAKGGHALDLEHLQPFIFRCPHGHLVDGNPGDLLPVAIAGASGASKSHFLPALARDLYQLRTLDRQGVRLEKLVHGNDRLARDVAEIYEERRVLPATRVGRGLIGPYSYALRIRGESEARTLLLFDIAGEAFRDVLRISRDASYLLLCRALIYLVDPVGLLPTQFDSDRQRTTTQPEAALTARRGIGEILETLEHVHDLERGELDIPICVVMGKADAVRWPAGFEWRDEARPIADEHPTLRQALETRSEHVRAAVEALGARVVVEEVEELRGVRLVRYAAASATSAMPRDTDGGAVWVDDPVPHGVALVFQHVLDLVGIAVTAGNETHVADPFAAADVQRSRHGADPGDAALIRPSHPRRLPVGVAIAFVGLLASALAAMTGHSYAMRTRHATPVVRTVRAPGFSLDYPASWHDGKPPANSALPAQISLRSPSGGGVIAGVASTSSWFRLPDQFLAALQGAGAVSPKVVRVGRALAFEYSDIVLAGGNSRGSVVTVALTRSLDVVFACWGPLPVSICSLVVGSARFTRATLDPRPDARFANAMSEVLARFAASRRQALQSFRAASTASEQATAASSVSKSYALAAAALGSIEAPTAVARATRRLQFALAAAAARYRGLAAVARTRRGGRYEDDVHATLRAVTDVDRTIEAFRAFGFQPEAGS